MRPLYGGGESRDSLGTSYSVYTILAAMASFAGDVAPGKAAVQPRKIQKLEEAVVNRIAAGEARKTTLVLQLQELNAISVLQSSDLVDSTLYILNLLPYISVTQVIQRPANALKEMLENR